MSLNLRAFREIDARFAFFRAAIARVRELPGVDAVSVGGPLPFAPAQVTERYWRRDDGDSVPSLGMQQTIMPGYFGVMGIPLRSGRDFTDDDITGQRSVVIVDERLAAQLWQGDAIGKRLALATTKTLEVVGVAAPIRVGRVRDESVPTIFVPYHVYEIEQTLVIKTHLPVAVIGPMIKRTVESLGPGRPVFSIRPMSRLRRGLDRRHAIYDARVVGVRRGRAAARRGWSVRHAHVSHLAAHAGSSAYGWRSVRRPWASCGSSPTKAVS